MTAKEFLPEKDTHPIGQLIQHIAESVPFSPYPECIHITVKSQLHYFFDSFGIFTGSTSVNRSEIASP